MRLCGNCSPWGFSAVRGAGIDEFAEHPRLYHARPCLIAPLATKLPWTPVNSFTPQEIDQHRGLVQRIAASPEFQRAARPRDPLVFLCERALAGRTAELREQDIGVHVFGRGENFDIGSDNIVRVQATLLRRRLGTYFAQHGANEPVVIEIPQGRYVPEFHERKASPAPSDSAQPDRRKWILAAAFLGVAAAA